MSLVGELKRRRVVRVAMVYGAAAFALLQGADIVAPALRLPDWTMTMLVLLLALGLPVAIILAWAFQVTPEGVQREVVDAGTQEAAAATQPWITPRSAVAAGFLLFAGAAGAWVLKPQGVGNAEAISLAVLPFTNLGAPDDEYFADGVSDALRGKLAAVEGLVVIASSSTRPYRDTDKTARQIGRELGVEYLLTGRVRWAKAPDGTSRVQVSPELIATETGTTRWQRPFDAVLSDVFAVQGEITSRVADALSVSLLEPQRRELATAPTTNLEAYDAFLRASRLLAQAELGVSTHMKAAAGFRGAVDLDPSFALAWARLSYAHSAAYWFYEDASAARLRLARAAADTALTLAPAMPEALLADGYYWYWGWRSYRQALAAFERAHALDPRSAVIESAIGAVLRRQGKWEESTRHLKRAFELDPRNPVLARELGLILSKIGALDEAERFSAQAVTLAPEAIGSYLFRASVQLAREESDAATQTIHEAVRVIGADAFALELANRSWVRWLPLSDSSVWRVLEHLPLTSEVVDTGSFYLTRAEWLDHAGQRARAAAVADSATPFLEARARAAPDDWWFLGQLAVAHALGGRREAALTESARSLAALQRRPDGWERADVYRLAARVAVALGDHDAAIGHLARALEPPSTLPRAFLRADGRFTELRDDPRFQALVRPGLTKGD